MTIQPSASPSNDERGRRPRVCLVPYLDENPYQRELATHLRAQGVDVGTHWSLATLATGVLRNHPVPDLIHLHWLPRLRPTLTGFRRMLGYLLRIWLLRIFGRRFVWTVHNLYHHEVAWPRVERWLAKRVIASAAEVVVHSPIARDLVIREFKVRRTEKLVVVPHGNYVGCYAHTVSRAEARARLGVAPEALVFLFFGQIRPYKGVPELVSAFRQLDQPTARLVVAGQPMPAALARVVSAAGSDGRILLRPGFVPDDEVQIYLTACDVAVSPYRDVLTSGAVILAMSFGRACIAPALGCIPDVLDARGAFLYDAEDPDGLHRALAGAVEHRDRLDDKGLHNLERVKEWDWEKVARQTAAVYANAMHPRGATGSGRRPESTPRP